MTHSAVTDGPDGGHGSGDDEEGGTGGGVQGHWPTLRAGRERVGERPGGGEHAEYEETDGDDADAPSELSVHVLRTAVRHFTVPAAPGDASDARLPLLAVLSFSPWHIHSCTQSGSTSTVAATSCR